MPASSESPERAEFSWGGYWLELLICLTIVFLYVGSIPPGVNESHYLPKAKHLWDPQFASGGDIFLESHDSHLLASTLAGNLAKYCDLTTVAWVGRVASWTLLSVAWIYFGSSVGIPRVLRSITLLGWMLLVQYGNLAGEWFVGGFEAKAIAYPLALIGLAEVVRDRWNRAWIWLASAVAFHPVVGGWIGLSTLGLWLLYPQRVVRLRQQMVSLLVGCAIGLIGVWPALGGLGGSDRDGIISAAQVHAFFRLAHHMCPRVFPFDRWVAFGATVAVFAGVVICVRKHQRRHSRPVASFTTTAAGQLTALAGFSLLISALGLCIDLIGFQLGQSSVAAKLLRFYWFRWADVAVPLAAVTMAACLVAETSFGDSRRTIKSLTTRGSLILGAYMVLIGALGLWHFSFVSKAAHLPVADQWMIEQAGPFPVKWPSGQVDPESGWPQRYIDWLAVCDWIKHNTPEDSLWFTPKYQQTFKWYAQRAEVVSWKDVPQDNQSILQWYRRIEKCGPHFTADGQIRSWRTDEFIELAREYRFQWLLVDLSYQDQPPLLECKYPINIENRSFAVFHVSELMLRKPEQ